MYTTLCLPQHATPAAPAEVVAISFTDLGFEVQPPPAAAITASLAGPPSDATGAPAAEAGATELPTSQPADTASPSASAALAGGDSEFEEEELMKE